MSFFRHHSRIGLFTEGIQRIDPTQMSEEESLILDKFLLQQRIQNKKVFLPETEYTVYLPDETNPKKLKAKKIMLTHQIVYRPKKLISLNRVVPRYTVRSDKVLGRGSYGSVYRVAGTLAHNREGGMHFSNKKNRILKEQQHLDEEAKKESIKESELLKRSNAHAKEITIDEVDGVEKSFIVAEEFFPDRGVTLEKFFYNNKPSLSLNARFQLSINLLRALQEQVHDKKIAHRDIKPQNIIIDPLTLKVKIVDFGLSRESELPDLSRLGTPAYMAPEAAPLKNNLMQMDESSDAYAMGLILAEVWGSDARTQSDHQYVIQAENMLLRKASRESLDHLFESVQGINMNQKDKIKGFLHAITCINKYHRKTGIEITDRNENIVDRGIDLFDAMFLDYRTNDESIKAAHRAAKNVYEDLRMLQLASSTESSKFPEKIKAALAEVQDSPEAIKEFVHTLGIETVCAGLERKNDVIVKIDQIAEEFPQNVNNILSLLAQTEKNIDQYTNLLEAFSAKNSVYLKLKLELQYILEDIQILLDKHLKRGVNVTDVAQLNTIFKLKMPQLESRLLTLKNDLQSHQLTTVFKEIYDALDQNQSIKTPRQLLEKKDPTNALRCIIKNAINIYMRSTLTIPNIKKSAGAASSRRCQDIKDILDLLNVNDPDITDATLLRDLETKLKNIKPRFTSSKLRSGIRDAIKHYHALKNSVNQSQLLALPEENRVKRNI